MFVRPTSCTSTWWLHGHFVGTLSLISMDWWLDREKRHQTKGVDEETPNKGVLPFTLPKGRREITKSSSFKEKANLVFRCCGTLLFSSEGGERLSRRRGPAACLCLRPACSSSSSPQMMWQEMWKVECQHRMEY